MSTQDSTSDPTIEIKTLGGRVLFVSSQSSVKAALEEASLWGAYLRDANLRDANLQGANLQGANLQYADLQGANLQGANHADIAIARTRILPDEGDIIGWKKAQNVLGGAVIVKLRIPSAAKRSHASGRKCRASKAEVLAISSLDGEPVREAVSRFDSRFVYRVGDVVEPRQPFDEDPWNECASGIHFYVTRLEAVAHV